MLPTPTSRATTERKQLQTEYLKIRRDLNATSSQDEFARWAKLRRQHDKLMEQLEKMSALSCRGAPLPVWFAPMVLHADKPPQRHHRMPPRPNSTVPWALSAGQLRQA